jgi:hypothetical protein
MKNDNEERKNEEDIKMNPEDGLSAAQLDLIEKEVIKKLKKERTLDSGVRNIKEKAPFNF